MEHFNSNNGSAEKPNFSEAFAFLDSSNFTRAQEADEKFHQIEELVNQELERVGDAGSLDPMTASQLKSAINKFLERFERLRDENNLLDSDGKVSEMRKKSVELADVVDSKTTRQ